MAEIKTENLDSDPVVVPSEAPSVTESAPKKVDSVKLKTVKPSLEGMTIREYVRHVALWNEPKLSAKYLLGAMLVFYFTGKDSHSIPGFITLLVLERTFAVFAISAIGDLLKHKENSIAKSIGELFTKSSDMLVHYTRLPNQSSVKFWVNGTASYAEQKLISVVETLREAEHDVKKLKVVLLNLIAVLLTFTLFSLRTVFFTTYFVGMIVPAIYSRQYQRIDPLLSQVVNTAKPHVDQLRAKVNEYIGKAAESLETARKQAGKKLEQAKDEVTQKVNERISKMKHHEETAEPKKTK